jgi:acyl dehydratase
MDTTKFTGPSEIEVPVEYNSRDLILYALGIGSKDHRFVYENHELFAAFPTYAIVLMFKGNSFSTLPFPPPSLTSFPTPPLQGVKAGLDAEKKIERLAELPKDGSKLKLVGRVCGIHKKGPGALVEREYKLVGEDGTTYYKMIDAAMLVGAKDFQDSGITHSKNNLPPKDMQPMHVFNEKTDEHQPMLYRLSGDYNPLHIDPMMSQMMGFEKPIMHGQCTMGIICRVLLEKLANSDQRRYKSIAVRFASPVIPGDTLSIEVWPKTSTDFIFQAKNQSTGKVCVSNGLLELHPEAKL